MEGEVLRSTRVEEARWEVVVMMKKEVVSAPQLGLDSSTQHWTSLLRSMGFFCSRRRVRKEKKSGANSARTSHWTTPRVDPRGVIMHNK